MTHKVYPPNPKFTKLKLHQLKDKVCARCGIRLPLFSNRRKYCESCGKIVAREQKYASIQRSLDKRRAVDL